MLSVFVFSASFVFSGCQPDLVVPQGQGSSDTHTAIRLTSVSHQAGSSFSQQLSAEIPEFGGAFFDTAGVLNVYLTDLSVAAVAEGRVRAKLAKGRSAGRQVRFLQGEYRYAYLESLKPRVYPLFQQGMTAVGIDERNNRLWLGMISPAAIVKARAFAAQHGIPLGSLSITLQPQFHVLSSHTLSDAVRPLIGGLKISSSTSNGSAAGIVVFNNIPYLLISGHVADPSGHGDTAGTISQPSSSVGTVWRNPSFTYAKCGAGFTENDKCRRADAALVALGSGIGSGGLGKIAAPGTGPSLHSGTLTFDDSSPTNVLSEGLTCSSGNGCDPGYDVTGVPVSKVGYVTGWTGGDILAVDVTLLGDDGFYRLHSTVAKGSAKEGDSGGSVLDDDRTRLLGLVWGGASVYGTYFDSVFSYSPLREASLELTGDPFSLHSIPARLLGHEARYIYPYSCITNPDAWNIYIIWGWPDGHGSYDVTDRQPSGHTTYWCGSGYVNGDFTTYSPWVACEGAFSGSCPDALSVSGGTFTVLEPL